MKKLYFLLSILLSVLTPVISTAQVTVVPGVTAAVLASKLIGPGVVMINPVLTCATNAYGTFSGPSTLSFDSGIVLTNGTAKTGGGVIGCNGPASGFASTANGTPGDAQLTALAGQPTYDACILEFDFRPSGDTVKFDYVFGSEEYTDYTCSDFNDVFGFFISGPGYAAPQNIALVPGTTIPVCINSVNCGGTGGYPTSTCNAVGPGSPFCTYYVNNSAGTTITYDGLTKTLTAIASVTPCDTYHLKIGVADASDDVFDSGVFLKAGSLTSTGVDIISAGINPLDTGFAAQYCIRGCTPGKFIFGRTGNLTDSFVIHFDIAGTAANGYDYTTIADSVIIPANDSTDTLFIHGLIVPPAGPKTVELLIIAPYTCGGLPVIIDSAELTIYDSFFVHINTPDTSVCFGHNNILISATGDPSLTYTWSPSSTLSSSTILSPTASPTVTTTYTVTAQLPGTGCAPSHATITISVFEPYPAPVITGPTFYCQGTPFTPFVVTDSSGAVIPASDLFWYVTATGGLPTTTPLTVNTNVPGSYTVWASHTQGTCEGPRGSLTVRVRTTPPAPLITGTMQYCQHIGPYVPLDVHTVTGGTANWYTAASGGSPSATEPIPNINVAGVNSYWVSQTDSGCEGPRQPVTITIHPQPAPPVVHPQPWCQFRTPSPVSATPSEAGDNLLWYGPGGTVGTSTAPTPPTSTAPDTINYYVTETSSFGCVSDSSEDVEIVITKPAAPLTKDISYCQYATAAALNAEVDSAANSNLNWYFNGTLLPAAPVPPTDTTPGSATWYVTQTVNTCESDSGSVTVTILYKPVFGITPGQPWVCQFDSISVKYSGPALVAPSYTWTLPEGATFGSGTLAGEDSVIVKFDSAVLYNYVGLMVSDYGGTCSSDTTIRINIVTQPTAAAFTKPDVCLGDTVNLALTTISDDANNYAWYIDTVVMQSSPAVTIITSNSNTGGPFSISWMDSGRHVIEVYSYSEEGCKSAPTFDSVDVHAIPDAHFKITSFDQSGCIGDTVQFTADVAAYNDLYVWSPAHSFENVNTPSAWGQIQEANTIITLTVTDPFGCVATENMEIDPQSCCTVSFPNAFTPNGDGKNDFFRPIYTGGFHHFHAFRVVNRWGQTVFSSENSGMQWDGNYNGVPQDMGTYFYYIKYDCGGKTIEQKGDVTLLR